jgi:hypothetical protein
MTVRLYACVIYVGLILKIYKFVQKYENRSFRQSWDYVWYENTQINIDVSISDFHNNKYKGDYELLLLFFNCIVFKINRDNQYPYHTFYMTAHSPDLVQVHQ